LGQQTLLADGVPGGSKNRPSENFGHIVPPTSRDFTFNQKKKVMVLENYVMLKKHALAENWFIDFAEC
jgi:hypothetical protein